MDMRGAPDDMSNVAPAPSNLHEWIGLVQKRSFVVRVELSNGQSREGRIVGRLEDFIMLSAVALNRQPRVVALGHVVAIDIVEDGK